MSLLTALVGPLFVASGCVRVWGDTDTNCKHMQTLLSNRWWRHVGQLGHRLLRTGVTRKPPCQPSWYVLCRCCPPMRDVGAWVCCGDGVRSAGAVLSLASTRMQLDEGCVRMLA